MKFKIMDDCGDIYSVEERELKEADKELADDKEVKAEPEKEEPAVEATQDADPDFSKEEIEILKKLIAKSDEILALLEVEKDEHNVDSFEEEAENQKDDEEVVEISEEEDVISDSLSDEEDTMIHDSKKSANSIESKKSALTSDIDEDYEIAQAWAKHYGGK